MQNRLLSLALAFCSVLALGFVFFYIGTGFDNTDEGFYLHWIAAPWAYDIHMPFTLFGFVYHPLFVFFDSDIPLLRAFNLFLLYGLAGILSYQVLRRYLSCTRGQASVFGLALASTALLYYQIWTPTPSYNALNFTGLLLAVLGLVFANDKSKRNLFIAWSLVGIGGWLVFMAKPSTAAVLAFAVIIYLWVVRYPAWRFVLYGACLSGVLAGVTLFTIDPTPLAVIHRFVRSMDAAHALDSGQTFNKIFRLDDLPFKWPDYLSLVLLSGGLAAFAYYDLKETSSKYAYCICGVFVLLSAGIVLFGLGMPSFRPRILLGFPMVAFAAYVWQVRKGAIDRLPRDVLASGWLLFWLPYMYAFGTNGNYWKAGAEAGFFWILASIVFLIPYVRKSASGIGFLFPVFFLLPFLAIVVVAQAIDKPQRQPESLRGMNTKVMIAGSALTLSQTSADYYAISAQAAHQSGFTNGMPVIDLTGRSPGTLYALSARGLGQPWLVGGYPGSDAFAILTLGSVPCADIATAWLLIEPGGPRALNTGKVLASLGATLAQDYQSTQGFVLPADLGNYQEAKTQYFLKPMRTPAQAEAACEAARREGAMQ